MAKKTKKTDQAKVNKIEEEKLKIFRETDQIKGELLIVSNKGNIESRKELMNFAIKNIENPENKYDLYYRGISRLLLKYLPKGKRFKVARSYIYEEKNVYLTRGKRINRMGFRGADGRMGYYSDAKELLNIIMDWIKENGSMFDLYKKLRNININKGYGSRNI
jgi:hypothetical protein